MSEMLIHSVVHALEETAKLLPFLFISVITTPIVYCATAWSTQLLMALVDKKEAKHD